MAKHLNILKLMLEKYIYINTENNICIKVYNSKKYAKILIHINE